MATLGSNALTLRDTAEAMRKADGSLKPNIIDLVSQKNDILSDTTFMRADNGDKLSSDFLNANPHGEWVALGEGVSATKTGFSTAWDTCGRIKARIQIPTEIYERTKEKDALVERHIRAISNGLREDVATALFYANIANEPKKFNGLADFYDRYAKSSTTRRAYAFNVINASGDASARATYLSTSGNTFRSIWLVGWGDLAVTCFYPENSTAAGLKLDAMKEMPISGSADGSGKVTWHKTQELTWEIGLAVRNYQYAGRICNIERETAIAGTTTGDNYAKSLLKHLRHLRARVKKGGVRQAFYMDETMWEVIEDAFSLTTNSNAIKYGDLQQSKPDTLWGIPIHLCDCLDTAEAAVAEIA